MNSINVRRPGAPDASEVVPNATSPQLVGRDALVFARGRSLFTAGSTAAIRLTSDPRGMDIQVRTTGYSAAPMYAVAGNGTLVYAPWPGGRGFVWIDRNGREESVKAEERMYAPFRLSPDGTRLAATVVDDDRDRWVIALDGSFAAQRLSSGAAREANPVWSPRRTEIFFTTAERTINRVPGDGSTGARKVFEPPAPGAIDPFVSDNRARNYTSAGRRPHALTFHYAWLVPGASPASSPWLRALANDWQISGLTTFLSGTQGGFTYTYSGVPTGTLSGTGSIGGTSRPRIVCDPSLPRSERTFERQFRTECIAPPDDEFRVGTARGDEFQGPGYMNWDISVFKNIPMGSTRRLQFRVELYNAFDTDQWTSVNTTAAFNYTTGDLTNPTVFGSLTDATHGARQVQLAARFTF